MDYYNTANLHNLSLGEPGCSFSSWHLISREDEYFWEPVVASQSLGYADVTCYVSGVEDPVKFLLEREEYHDWTVVVKDPHSETQVSLMINLAFYNK